MNIFSRNILLFLIFSLLLMYLLPFFVMGENSYIRIHDNLDSNVVWFKILAESGQIFDNSNSVIQSFMGGTPRISFGSEFNFILWLYYFFEPFLAYVINIFLIHLIAFLGMYLLLKKYIFNSSEQYFYLLLISLLFALLPFWPSGGLSVAGLPIATYSFLNFRNRTQSKYDFLILFLIPFYSSLVLSFMFYISLLFMFWIYDFIQGKRNYIFLASIFIFSLLYLLVEYRLVQSILVGSNFISHRVERLELYVDFMTAIKHSVRHIILGHSAHAASEHIFTIIIIIIAFVVQVKTKMLNKLFIILILLHFTISIWFGFWDYEGWREIKDKFKILLQLDLARYFFLTPLIWYVLLAVSVNEIIKTTNKTIINIVISLLLFQVIFLFYKGEYIQEYKLSKISYSKFFAKKQFKEISDYIGLDHSEYRVVSLGMHPSIAQYNDFHTIDGYIALYLLEYKHIFRRVIAKELNKSEKLKKYYDNWGSRVYLFSSELQKNYLNTNENIKNINIEFDYKELLKMNCKYVFSAVKINNEKVNHIEFLKKFDSQESAWTIYLYKVIGNVPEKNPYPK